MSLDFYAGKKRGEWGKEKQKSISVLRETRMKLIAKTEAKTNGKVKARERMGC
jgi:hypothetical protein